MNRPYKAGVSERVGGGLDPKMVGSILEVLGCRVFGSTVLG